MMASTNIQGAEAYILNLPLSVLGSLWPDTHLIMGLRVNRILHTDLLPHSTGVRLKGRDTEYGRASALLLQEPRPFRHTLQLFKNHHIHLHSAGLDTRGLTAMLESITHTTTGTALRTLTLSGSYDEQAPANLMREVLSSASQLSTLSLGENYRTAAARDYAWWQDMAICGPIPPKLRLTQWGARLITEALARNTTLTHLDLRLHNIGPRGATQIAHGLGTWTALHYLDLTGNAIHNEGFSALSLVFNSSIQTLLLRDNHITEEGLISFTNRAAILAIQRLDISSNRFLLANPLGGIEAQRNRMDSFLAGLGHMNSITDLDLSSTMIDDVALTQLASHFRTGPLATLDLSHNRINPPGIRRMAHLLRTCTTLQDLNLAYNMGGRGFNLWGTG